MTEISLAGAILLDDQCLKEIQNIVSADDFQNERCKAVFSAACSLAADGEVVDPISITERAKRFGTTLDIEWIRQAIDIVPTAANAAFYANQVAEDARCRRIKALALQIVDNSISTSSDLLADIQRGVDQIQSNSICQGLNAPDDRIRGLFDQIIKTGESQFIPSGFPQLDSILGGGFIRGGLYIIGARPAVGKTTFALNLAERIKGNVLFVSLEMSPEAITAKQFSRLIGVSVSDILKGSGGDELWQKLAAASARISASGIYLNRRYDLTPGQLQMLAQSVPDLQAIVVDYLGLLLPNTPTASTYERISAISRELKRIALQTKVPVVCLSQLSRGVEGREDKRPRLSDLRDSGAIEQDADAVMFLYRDDYYKPELDTGGSSVVELTVAKNRHGSLGKVEMLAFLHTSYFRERSANGNEKK